jgi:hypothetical protein
MSGDRYLKAVLTIIALELGWIAATNGAPPVSAQAPAADEPARVIIAGVDLRGRADFLPVGVIGQMRTVAPAIARSFQPLDTTVRNAPLQVALPQPLDVRTVTPIRIDSDRPIKVENVGYTPAQRPGE